MAENMLVGAVTNGEYKKTEASKQTTKSDQTTSTSKTAGKQDGGYNQEMFLKLLVAEMQYQDPMEPSDNSQYVAQLASFTQIEAIQSVQDDMHSIQAQSLVGKTVVINSDHEEIRGKVDYVTSDDEGTMYVSVNDKQYKVSEIDSVVDTDYYNAVTIVETFNTMVAKLPILENVTIKDENDITNALNVFNSMDTYTRGFVKEDVVKHLETIANRLNELKNPKKETDNKDETSSTEDTLEKAPVQEI
ncbi:flagellar basal-body rod modification protein FlgD [Pseudobutyrivibrio sp. ACV-2]|uniref:flagellar hook assembly protein FlgD n=1 Tax=Pseudobutyrivibrio sp. ACV-2 TaxID=1520801 RepID=UPI000899D592|nr:flagellar hook capping FlgD N-terminal domain-containing protein [Pseudobutyrivibrio sp. ACV-2]SDZ85895.1 flagellar basal-body rod modification protein FlgD [Pseudobutyrivibrio sp. ACV-2]